MYVNTYKTHAMATHHRGTGQLPLEDAQTQENNVVPPYEPQEEMDIIEQNEQLKDLTKTVDDLRHHLNATNEECREAISRIESELNRLTLMLHPSAPPEPIDNLLQQYTETLCTAQQKTTFTNNLLQDITICSGTDTSQLENWLTDIESAANLTHEIHTKLAQAKPKGLTHTLISEALNLDKSWDKIKDLL